MMKNEWLQKEVNAIKNELKSKKKRGDELFPLLMTMVIFLLIATSSMYACPSPTYSQINNSSIFPSTWTCPNRSCGYENYEGVSHCAICGSRRR